MGGGQDRESAMIAVWLWRRQIMSKACRNWRILYTGVGSLTLTRPQILLRMRDYKPDQSMRKFGQGVFTQFPSRGGFGHSRRALL